MTHLAHKLHNLIEVVFLLQHLAHNLTDVYKVGVKLVVEGLQGFGVLAVADQPVHTGEVLALGQLLVQAPEHLAVTHMHAEYAYNDSLEQQGAARAEESAECHQSKSC